MRAAHQRQGFATVLLFMVILGAEAVTNVAAGQRGGRGGRGAQGGGGGQTQQADTTTGFVMRDQTIISSCSECHKLDSAGYMQRISYMRKTPEGWETSIRRMVTLNGVNLDQETARAIVRYLSDYQGIAPAELRPGRF